MHQGSAARPAVLLSALLLAGPGACGGDSAADDADGTTDVVIDGGGPTVDAADLPHFSFFVTSLDTMVAQSGSEDGFGGDLGGLAGADAICQTAAAAVGFGAKTWRAFLSVTDDGTGSPVDAISRIGDGPWYDRNGRLIAEDIAGLLHTRPAGDAQTINDLPDENGVPTTTLGDTHDILTGSDQDGTLASGGTDATCDDWTSASEVGFDETVPCGHSWPAPSGQHWIRSHTLRGCAPGVNLVQNGPGSGHCVGCGGGWGAIYCFALEP